MSNTHLTAKYGSLYSTWEPSADQKKGKFVVTEMLWEEREDLSVELELHRRDQ